MHTERYGTRSAMIVSVGLAGAPRVSVAAGPPCVTPLLDVTGMWVIASWPARRRFAVIASIAEHADQGATWLTT